MDFRSTKDTYEREEEEAERLVRPAPKVKPPRHDKRREDTQTDRDPDVAGDPDISGDPDMSLNYKSVGGSIAGRILARFLTADEPSERIKMRKKDTGNIVYITKDTLRERGGEYESADEEETKSKEKPESEEKKDPEEEELFDSASTPKTDLGEAGRKLWEQAESDPKLNSQLSGFLDPKSGVSYLAQSNPSLSVKYALPGYDVPESIKTIADLQQAVAKGKGAKKPQPPKGKGKAPEEKQEGGQPTAPAKPDPLADRLDKLVSVMERYLKSVPPEARPQVEKQIDEAKKEVQKERDKPVPEDPKPAKKDTPPPPKDKNESPRKPGESTKEWRTRVKNEKAQGGGTPSASVPDKTQKIVEKFKQEVLANPEDKARFDAYAKGLPTTLETKDGVQFRDDKDGDFKSFDKLSPDAQKRVVDDYDRRIKRDETVELVKARIADDPKAQEALSQLLDRRSDLSERLNKLRDQGHDPDVLPIGKNIPELKDIKFPFHIKTVGDLRKFLEKEKDVFRKKEPIEEWVASGGPKTPEFKEWAEKNPKLTVEKDGTVLFPTRGKGKTNRVPWEQLPEEAQQSLHDEFQKDQQANKNVDLVYELGADPQMAKVLRGLSNPKSNLARHMGSDDLDIKKAIPELEGVNLPKDMTLGDFISAAKRAFPTLPEPKRRKATRDEEEGARMALDITLPHSALSVKLRGMGLHPDDAQDVLTQYEQMKSVKIKPEDLKKTLEDSADFYVEDPEEVPYPRTAKNAKGQITKWTNLTPEEQALAYAKHRNQVVAASMALQQRVANSLMDKSGLPPALASVLAGMMLKKQTGTPEEIAEKSRAKAEHIYESTLESGIKSEPIDDNTIKTTLERTKDDPVAHRAAVAYFQAQDYLDARDKFLSTDGPDQIDEREPPQAIAVSLGRATKYLQQKAKRYPKAYTGALDAAAKFRARVMNRLRVQNPEKAAEVQPFIQKADADDWDNRKKVHEDLTKEWRAGVQKYNKAFEEAEKAYNEELRKSDDGSKGVQSIDDRLKEKGVVLPPKPDPLPEKPFGYDDVRKGPAGVRSMGRRLLDKLLKRKAASASDRVLTRYALSLAFSTCAEEETMGKPLSTPKNASGRTAVYWGVEPYPADKGYGLYPRWQQAQARDLNDVDFDNILTAAKKWLKAPVLSTSFEDVVPDVQFRAALDLALRDHDQGKYSAGLYPTLYNRLLARLAGKSEDETLLTIREASGGSVYAKSPGGEKRPMSASAQLRKYAATIADSNPGIAFDLSNLAFKLAEDEQQGQEQEQQGVQASGKAAGEMPPALKEHMEKKKEEAEGKDQGQGEQKEASYRSLKAAVLNAAKANPTARAAFMPVLQTIKKIG